MEARVGEVEQPRGIIGHHVGLSWEVGDLVAIAVLALVVAGELAEVRCRARGGDGSFSGSRDSRGVVAKIFECGIANWVAVCHHISLRKKGTLL